MQDGKKVIYMDRKKVFIAASAACVILAVMCVTATPRLSTPLYTYRMEQASSKMNFLPTEKSIFAYTTEKGYSLNCNASFCDRGHPNMSDTYEECTTIEITCITCPGTCTDTCWPTCTNTCQTCPATCPGTCKNTCGNTCQTCEPTCLQITCYTCFGC